MNPVWTLPIAAGAGALACASVPGHDTQRLHEDRVLGTSLDAVAVCADPMTGRRALQAARAEIARLEPLLSGWSKEGALAGLNAARAGIVAPELFEVIALAERYRAYTDGAFDARLGAARRAHDEASLRAFVLAAHGGEVRLDADARFVSLGEGVELDLDAIAKGYVIDSALRAARRASPALAGFMLDLGGDSRCFGDGPSGSHWRVGLPASGNGADNAPLAAIIALRGAAIATSGRGLRDRETRAGLRSHLIDPSSGVTLDAVQRVTVIAATAVDADALSTAMAAMPVSRALALADAMPGVAALIETDHGRHTSGRWDANVWRVADNADNADTAGATGSPWPKGYAALVDYEVPKIEAGNYRAPYVAIWVTDADKQLVRTLVHLGNDPKWLDSNYMWWRRFGRKMTAVDTVTQPTRKPGRYSVQWDGLDAAGQRVPQGRYVIHVEATREHGGHTYQSFDVELGAQSVEQVIAPKDELGALKLAFGVRT